MRGDFSTTGVVWWRLAEAGGGGWGVEQREGRSFTPAGTTLWHEPKKNTQNRLTMFMHCLLAKDGFSTNTAATINTPPYLCLAAGSYTEPEGLRERRPRCRSLGANVEEEPAGQTNTRRSLFQSTNQTSPLPAFHGAEGRRDGRTGTPGSLYYTFNEIL